jgi:hypothetical protein
MNLQEALKEMYKCHLGNSIFNIDKLEALIEKLIKENENLQEELNNAKFQQPMNEQ